MMKIRFEDDSLGRMSVPAEAMYGAQTARALANFPISGLCASPALIRAYLQIKLAAARVNKTCQVLPEGIPEQIVRAIQQILSSEQSWRDLFPVDVYQNLNKAKQACHDEESPVGVFDLVREGNEIIKRPNLKGSFHILASPQPTETYIGGIDPIPFGDANEKEGSDNALIIKGVMTQEYVAYICERDLDSDVAVEKCILLQEYYKSQRYPHGAIANVEKNRGEVLIKTYKDKGKEHLLSNTPTHLGIEYVDKKIKKGWFNNDHTMIRGNHYQTEFLKKHAIRLRLLKLITEILRFPIGNNDLFDAMRSCEILDAELSAISKKMVPQMITRRLPITTMDSSGRTIVKWVNV